MKRYYIFITLIISLVFVACNKDEDIIIDSPPPVIPGNQEYTVMDYTPAPGQYINESAIFQKDITTKEEACAWAQNRLAENKFVSLGAWGGYIIVKFDTPIDNKGDYDFAIAGNNFDSSNEPGIVWVKPSEDNTDGLDKGWYELKGSYYDKPDYIKDFWVTYYKPEPGKDTRWEDKDGNEGYVKWMGSYHDQDFYYPLWVNHDSYTLYGSKLPLMSEQDPITGQWFNPPFEWGYVDNSGSDVALIPVNNQNIRMNRFKISDAVDSDGQPVNIRSVSYIKVQTGIMGEAGILGENSTEVCGFIRL